MSLKDRLLDGFNTLTEKIGADDTPLSGVDPAALNKELERRAARKEAAPPSPPTDNPRARLALGGDDVAKRRAKAADERESRIRGERAKEAAKAKKDQDEAFRRMQQEARRQAPPRGSYSSGASRPGSGSGGSGRSRNPLSDLRRDKSIEAHYKTLDLPYGAPMAEVKSAYRSLMRKYHPDLHAGSPSKQKAATELSVKISTAYDALVTHLEKK